MLKKISIQQFVIIDKLDLDLKSGVTVLTGETGAGKSILLDALGLMLGEPADLGAIRTGSEEAKIQATFSLDAVQPVLQYLSQQRLVTPSQNEFTVTRTLRRGGVGEEIKIGEFIVDLPTLKKAGVMLCEIHGQFANRELLEASNQLHLLDMYGNFPPEVFNNVRDALAEVRRIQREFDEESKFLNANIAEMGKIERLVGRFNKLGMHANFIEESEAEYARLVIARDTSEAFQSVLGQLVASNGAVRSLVAANQVLSRTPNLEPEKMTELAAFLQASLDNARAAVDEMNRMAPDYDVDTKPIYDLEATLKELDKIAEETGIKIEDLTAYYIEIDTKLTRLKAARDKIKDLEGKLALAENEYRLHAHTLSEHRFKAAQEMGAEVTTGLAPLKLLRAEFQVRVDENTEIEWTDLGLNEVTFTARMNPGQIFSPIIETASGGELARLILALKVVLQRIQHIPTLVFDEVDTGIGGAAAAAVGERIAQLGHDTQVIVITHSPQVASRGDQHLHVTKSSDGFTTTSTVRPLTIEERIDEVSRMLSGDALTAHSRAAAKSLIDEAAGAAVKRKPATATAVPELAR